MARSLVKVIEKEDRIAEKTEAELEKKINEIYRKAIKAVEKKWRDLERVNSVKEAEKIIDKIIVKVWEKEWNKITELIKKAVLEAYIKGIKETEEILRIAELIKKENK